MSSLNRRKILIDRMAELENQGFHCKGCQGHCCTYEANSMMVTPLEACEIMHWLKVHHQDSPELKIKCQETVKQYRLDYPTGNGRRSYLRKTYTCPFFNHNELGCGLSRSVKPYGCLAFNAHHAEIKAQELCFSETDILEKRELADTSEASKNETLKAQLKLYWDKSPLPLALLDLWDKDLSLCDLGSS